MGPSPVSPAPCRPCSPQSHSSLQCSDAHLHSPVTFCFPQQALGAASCLPHTCSKDTSVFPKAQESRNRLVRKSLRLEAPLIPRGEESCLRAGFAAKALVTQQTVNLMSQCVK